MIFISIPVHNVEAYLAYCIDSILAQTYTDFELLLVDDGSTDNSPAICDKYVQQDSRIHVIHQEAGGVSAARNAGLDWYYKNSKAEWFFSVDSDDFIHPKCLEILLNAAETTGCAVNVCNYEDTPGDDVIFAENISPVKKYTPEDFFVEKNINAILIWGKLYRRDCFENVRYPVGKIHEDEYITHTILFQHEYISYIETPLCYYRKVPQSITRRAWQLKRMDASEAYLEQILFFKQRGFDKAYHACCLLYLKNLSFHIERVGLEYPDLKKVLCKRLRAEAKKYGKDAGISLHKDAWYHYNAYPQFKLYWLIINKFKQISGKFLSRSK